jgi:hypothetical protein
VTSSVSASHGTPIAETTPPLLRDVGARLILAHGADEEHPGAHGFTVKRHAAVPVKAESPTPPGRGIRNTFRGDAPP